MTTMRSGAVLRQFARLFGEGTVAGLTDAELLGRFAARRDEAAFAALVARHGPMVRATCRAVLRDPHAAEDAFQATFLILARKADALWVGDSLAGWLHRVAHRAALQARAEAARRRRHEAIAAASAGLAHRPEGPGDDEEVVRDELARLPERLRLPILLCDLEGLTRSQAADRLGWSEGAVRGRLARGRTLLKARLTRRGVAPATLLGSGLLGEAAAAIPEALREATGRVVSGAASASAVGLGEGVARAMLWGRLGWAAAALLAVGIATAALAIGRSGPVADRVEGPVPRSGPALAAQAGPPADHPAPEDDEETGPIPFRGRVLDPDGRPVPGARITMPSDGLKGSPNSPTRAVTDPDGRFRFEVPHSDFETSYETSPWRHLPVVAQAKGLAFGLAHRGRDDGVMTLRLARDDVPIEGRVLDLEGRPVAGASVRVRRVQVPTEGDLSPWLDALESEGEVSGTYRLGLLDLPQPEPPMFPPATTDPDGRFRIDGIGRERLVEAVIAGPTIETGLVLIRTRPGATIRAPEYKNSRPDLVTIYGSAFDHVAGPTRPVEGVVRDRDTGRPLAGVMVHDERATGNLSVSIESFTDAEGRYRLLGLPRGREGALRALSPNDVPYFGARKARLGLPPDESLPYLRAVVDVDDQPGPGPLRRDIGLRRGVWVRGRVLDGATGRPVRAQVEYVAFADNPHLAEAPGFSRAYGQIAFTGLDGAFRLVALPGRGLIGARAEEDRYGRGVGAEAIAGRDAAGYFRTTPGSLVPANFHVLAGVDPAEGAETLACDLILDPGRTVSGTVLGPEGEPLAGARASGLTDLVHWANEPLKAAAFTAIGLRPGTPRTLTFRHEGRRLVGQLVLDGQVTEPVSVRLRPWGTATGRIVDGEGQPRAGLRLMGTDVPGYPEVGPDGRFRLEGLLPGQPYRIWLMDARRYGVGALDREVVVGSGETLDLGDVRVDPPRP